MERSVPSLSHRIFQNLPSVVWPDSYTACHPYHILLPALVSLLNSPLAWARENVWYHFNLGLMCHFMQSISPRQLHWFCSRITLGNVGLLQLSLVCLQLFDNWLPLNQPLQVKSLFKACDAKRFLSQLGFPSPFTAPHTGLLLSAQVAQCLFLVMVLLFSSCSSPSDSWLCETS